MNLPVISRPFEPALLPANRAWSAIALPPAA